MSSLGWNERPLAPSLFEGLSWMLYDVYRDLGVDGVAAGFFDCSLHKILRVRSGLA